MSKHNKKRTVEGEHEEKTHVVYEPDENKGGIWVFATIVLGVLLVASIFTSGFRSIMGPSVDSVIGDLNTLNARDLPAGVKSALSNAVTSLESYKNSGKPSTGAAKVTIVEYSDFECPFCARAYPTVKQLQKDYAGQIVIEFKHFPLSFHANAQKAAEASECARDQGKFDVYHDTLFETKLLDVANLKKHASDLGLDVAKFTSCLDSGEKAAKVTADFQEGQAKGVRGTPTFFINGQQLVGAQPIENFKAVIDGILSGKAPEQPAQQQPDPEPEAPAEVPKTDKPSVEVFVMSHCPFGTQIEKGILPVAKVLEGDIDFKVKFVYYAMHGETEVYEQLNQYCIQEEQNDKYIDYLLCFLDAGDGEKCLADAKIDVAKLETCTKAADEKFEVTKTFNDQTTWLGGRFPPVNFDKEANEKYGVRGSPSLVINGVQVNSNRDSRSLLTTICAAFKDQPEGCKTVFEAASPSAGFGWEPSAQANNAAAGCGV